MPAGPLSVPPFTRRRFLHLAGLAGVGALTAACAGPGGDGGGAAALPSESAGGPVTGEVSFAHWRAEDKAVFDELVAAFVAANPDAGVEQDIAPSADYQSTALRRVRGAAVGDVFTTFRGAQFTSFVDAGVYASLDGRPVVDRYQRDLIEPGAQDGTQYGLPYQLVFNMPLVNVDALERAGGQAPEDWDGFLALLEAFRADGLVPLAWPGGDAANAGQLLNSMVMNNAPADDAFAQVEAGELKVTDDWFLRTLEQYAELRPFMQDNPTGTGVEPLQALFVQGRAGLLATGSFQMASLRTLGATFPFDLLAPITTSAADAKYEGIYNATFILGANADTEVPEAALAWIDFLSEPENAAVYANGTGQHLTVADVEYTNEDLRATAPWLTRNTLLAPRFQFDDLDIRAAVENATVAVVGGTSPEQAAEEAQTIIDQRVQD